MANMTETLEGSYQYRFYQLAADNLPITPIRYHPPADDTILVCQAARTSPPRSSQAASHEAPLRGVISIGFISWRLIICR